MRVQQREVFIADDGKEFVEREEAERHERKLRLTAVVEGFWFRDIDADATVDSLLAARDAVYKALA